MMNVVLLEPEMPANTGNIGRTCVATGTRLHLIEPLGFRLNSKAVQRAGLDYWEDLDFKVYMDFNEFMRLHRDAVFEISLGILGGPFCDLFQGQEHDDLDQDQD